MLPDMYRALSARDGAEAAAGMPGYFVAAAASFCQASSSSMGGGQTAPAPLDRAGLASRNHREAEKRRRERIKSHLDRLRILLACDPKTDKASLLAKAVEHVRDLKQQAAGIAEARLFPSETDEIVVLPASAGGSGSRQPVFEASVCCDDRSDLLPGLIETLRSLRMRALRAEMATLGGRVRNVMVLARDEDRDTGDNDGDDQLVEEEGEEGSFSNGRFLKEALVALVNRPVSPEDVARSKRRRMVDTRVA